MGTRSMIAVETEKGILASYCHWDGYPEHNGRILVNFYNDYPSALKLIRMGDISSLRESMDVPIGAAHAFDNPLDDVTVFYGRDRGDNDMGPTLYEKPMDMVGKNWDDFCYLFTDGKWHCIDSDRGTHIELYGAIKDLVDGTMIEGDYEAVKESDLYLEFIKSCEEEK